MTETSQQQLPISKCVSLPTKGEKPFTVQRVESSSILGHEPPSKVMENLLCGQGQGWINLWDVARLLCVTEWILKVPLNTTNFNLMVLKRKETSGFPSRPHFFQGWIRIPSLYPPKGDSSSPPLLLPWVKSSCNKPHQHLAKQRDTHTRSSSFCCCSSWAFFSFSSSTFM